MIYPPSDDPLVQAVQRLLEREGGHVAVGAAADISDQTLYQIAFAKVNSATGKPQGVGPSVRRRLDAAFPGWLHCTNPSLSHHATVDTVPHDLAEQLVALVAALPAARWRSIRAQLDSLAGAPEMRDDVLGEVRALLTADPGKRQAPG